MAGKYYFCDVVVSGTLTLWTQFKFYNKEEIYCQVERLLALEK